MSKSDTITIIEGLTVGHWNNAAAATGCSVVLCPQGAISSVDVRGGAPATRETDLLRTGNLVERVHAVLLSGGSAYGLNAAGGVMRWLEERGYGYPVTNAVVPIVPAACLYDFSIGSADVRPEAEAGYAACEAASRDFSVGSVGAGMGATVAKACGIERAIKGGIGTAAERTDSGITVGALVAVNSWGEIVDPDTGAIEAGPRGDRPGTFMSTLNVLRQNPPLSPFASENSTIGIVATDAALTKEQAYRLAVIAQTGLARTIRPVHTPVDGDIIFALATCRNESATDVLQLGALAARALERAVISAVRQATGLAGVPSWSEWSSGS